MFADCLARFADHVLVESGDARLGYGEVLALGERITGPLPRPKSLVVLRCGLDIASIAAHLSLTARGHVPLLLERSLAPALTADLVARYRPDLVIDAQAGSVEPGPGGVELHPDLGLLLATSGSTGSPKLVRQSATGVRANAEAIAAYLELGPAERPLLHLPMSYSYGLSVIHSHLVAGATLVLTGHTVMEPGYWADLAERRCTSIAGVPFHYAAIRRLGEARLDIPSLATLTQAGGRLDPRLVTHFADWAARTGRRFVVMYGQTEAGPRISWLPPDRALVASDSVGIAIPGVTIDLVDEEGRPVPDGAPGDMRVTSPAVMLGYAHEAADLARGDELGGVLLTGDIAERGPDGLLRIVGRRARMLKIYGLRVNLDEVEQKLASLGHQAVVGGVDDELRILLEDGTDPAGVRQAVVALFSLPPRGILVRGSGPVPRSAAGKVRAADFEVAWSQAA
jgi:acyl-CoA synthetase (AMP-forming)/AMP-acid ligase II